MTSVTSEGGHEPPTVPPGSDPAYDIEFFWDPICPFAWITSRWVASVAAQTGYRVDWRFISLRLINKHKDYERDFPPGYEFGHTADDYDLQREVNRHLAFGGGPHRCLGSHLARLELKVALEELHRRLPAYAVAEGATLDYSPGIREIASLPLVFDPKAVA